MRQETCRGSCHVPLPVPCAVPVRRALLRRPGRAAQVVRGVDQRDVRERLREVADQARRPACRTPRRAARRRCAARAAARTAVARRPGGRSARRRRPARSCRPGMRPRPPAGRRRPSSGRSGSRKPSTNRWRSTAAIVPRTRGSSGGRKPTVGSSSRLASSSFEPYDCTKLPSSASKPRAQTSVVDRLAQRAPVDRAGPSSPNASTARMPRSKRHPRHHLGVGEVPRLAAHLPDALSRAAARPSRGARAARAETPSPRRGGRGRRGAPDAARPSPRRTRRAAAGRARRCRSAPAVDSS